MNRLGRQAMTAYIGCYTDAAHPFGLCAVEVDPRTGRMEQVQAVRAEDAIYQCLVPGGDILVSCVRGGLAAFRREADGLAVSDRLDLGAECVCHASALADGTTVCWADYLAGEAGSVRIENGCFDRTSVVRHKHAGSGPNLPRQASAHCHQAIPLPEGRGYCVVDLGLDRLSIYPSGRHFPTVPEGAGPRHLVFHPGGGFAFLASELGNLVSCYRFSEERGFEFVSAASTLPAGWKGESAIAAIRMSGDGSRVFVSNRGHDSIAAFDFIASEGRLEPQMFSPLPGSWPRDFAFLAGEDMALVALERSGCVIACRYEEASGRFDPVQRLDGLYRPSSVLPAAD